MPRIGARTAQAGGRGLEHGARGIEPTHKDKVRREMLSELLGDTLDRLIDFDVTTGLTPDPQQQLHRPDSLSSVAFSARLMASATPSSCTGHQFSVSCDGLSNSAAIARLHRLISRQYHGIPISSPFHGQIQLGRWAAMAASLP